MKQNKYQHGSNILYPLVVTSILILLLLFTCKPSKQGVSEKRYVILSPEIAEIIATLEGVDNVVGITEECTFPETFKGKTSVGKFGTLNKELIVSLKPSIVFASSLEQQAIASELSKLGIPVVTVYPETIEEMLSGIITVGKAIGLEQRAVFVSDSLRSELEKVRSQAVGKQRPKVYLEIYREPLMSVSDASFVGELIELAGGDNIFATLERDYSRIKAEDVIKARPEVMICYSQDTVDNIVKRMGWLSIPAVRNRNILVESDLNPDWMLRAGPRCVLGAKRLQEILYETK